MNNHSLFHSTTVKIIAIIHHTKRINVRIFMILAFFLIFPAAQHTKQCTGCFLPDKYRDIIFENVIRQIKPNSNTLRRIVQTDCNSKDLITLGGSPLVQLLLYNLAFGTPFDKLKPNIQKISIRTFKFCWRKYLNIQSSFLVYLFIYSRCYFKKMLIPPTELVHFRIGLIIYESNHTFIFIIPAKIGEMQ